MTTPNPHRERDEAARVLAKAAREAYDGSSDYYFSEYDWDKAFCLGWSAALANDPCVRAMVEALEFYAKGYHIEYVTTKDGIKAKANTDNGEIARKALIGEGE